MSKDEYKVEVFREKAKITCQFIIMTILSMMFAGLFYTWLTLSHEKQVKAAAAAVPATPAATTAASTDPTKVSTATLFGLV